LTASAAEVVGMGRQRYEQAKEVVEAADPKGRGVLSILGCATWKPTAPLRFDAIRKLGTDQ
jgi:hypothetical protein